MIWGAHPYFWKHPSNQMIVVCSNNPLEWIQTLLHQSLKFSQPGTTWFSPPTKPPTNTLNDEAHVLYDTVSFLKYVHIIYIYTCMYSIITCYIFYPICIFATLGWLQWLQMIQNKTSRLRRSKRKIVTQDVSQRFYGLGWDAWRVSMNALALSLSLAAGWTPLFRCHFSVFGQTWQ